MNEKELRTLWQTTNEKLEESLLISKRNTEDITKLKVESFLSSMKPMKIFVLLVGMLWVGAGTVVLTNLLTYASAEVSGFFLLSASIQVGLTGVALLIYLYQLIIIHRVDITKPILKTQENLTSLKKSTLWVTRILFLQLPVWTTFYWNASMFENGSWFFWAIQCAVTLSFGYAAVWLFFNIRYENRDKKWFLLLFGGKEWTPLMKSMALLKQIEAYRIEENK